MRIGQVADRLAINPRTIRYYETVGLVPEPSRTQSGYRDCGEVDLRRIRFIKTARRLDLSIDEIRDSSHSQTGARCRAGTSVKS